MASPNIRSRQFSWDDVRDVHELISRAWAANGPRTRLHVGDFYWGLRPTPNGDPLRDIRLWEASGALAGLAWWTSWDDGEFLIAPDAPATMTGEMLAWLEESRAGSLVAGESIAFAVGAIEDDDERIELLRRRGYVRTDAGAVRFWRPLADDPEMTPPPAGITIHALAGDDDIERRVMVQQTSFESSSATVDVWRELMRMPGYRTELDLVAVADDGAGASGCTCWYDEANRAGQFEPVGTSRAFQRRGIGKAVIFEGLRRLGALGATQAIVQTNLTNAPAIALYRSCGFQIVAEDHSWAKMLP